MSYIIKPSGTMNSIGVDRANTFDKPSAVEIKFYDPISDPVRETVKSITITLENWNDLNKYIQEQFKDK